MNTHFEWLYMLCHWLNEKKTNSSKNCNIYCQIILYLWKWPTRIDSYYCLLQTTMNLICSTNSSSIIFVIEQYGIHQLTLKIKDKVMTVRRLITFLKNLISKFSIQTAGSKYDENCCKLWTSILLSQGATHSGRQCFQPIRPSAKND